MVSLSLASIMQGRQWRNFFKDCLNSSRMKDHGFFHKGFFVILHTWKREMELSCTWSLWPTFCRVLMHVLISLKDYSLQLVPYFACLFVEIAFPLKKNTQLCHLPLKCHWLRKSLIDFFPGEQIRLSRVKKNKLWDVTNGDGSVRRKIFMQLPWQ